MTGVGEVAGLQRPARRCLKPARAACLQGRQDVGVGPGCRVWPEGGRALEHRHRDQVHTAAGPGQPLHQVEQMTGHARVGRRTRTGFLCAQLFGGLETAAAALTIAGGAFGAAAYGFDLVEGGLDEAAELVRFAQLPQVAAVVPAAQPGAEQRAVQAVLPEVVAQREETVVTERILVLEQRFVERDEYIGRRLHPAFKQPLHDAAEYQRIGAGQAQIEGDVPVRQVGAGAEGGRRQSVVGAAVSDEQRVGLLAGRVPHLVLRSAGGEDRAVTVEPGVAVQCGFEAEQQNQRPGRGRADLAGQGAHQGCIHSRSVCIQLRAGARAAEASRRRCSSGRAGSRSVTSTASRSGWNSSSSVRPPASTRAPMRPSPGVSRSIFCGATAASVPVCITTRKRS
jgi:hypothetical protein